MSRYRISPEAEAGRPVLNSISTFREAWFRDVYNALYPELYSYLHTFTLKEDEIQDIIQDAFLKVLEKGRLEKILNIRTYMFSCVRNALFNHHRNSRNRERILYEMECERLADHDDGISTDVREEMFTLIEQAIETLPPGCRTIFTLAKKDGLPYKEIATRLGLSIKTVEVQMGIAFKKIREYYAAVSAELWK